MAIDATLPSLSSPIKPALAGQQAPQTKPAEAQGQATQTQQAVAPTEESGTASNNNLSAGNKEGRGQLVDLKI